MKYFVSFLFLSLITKQLFATDNQQLMQEIKQLQQQTQAITLKLSQLKKVLHAQQNQAKPTATLLSVKTQHDQAKLTNVPLKPVISSAKLPLTASAISFHDSKLVVHAIEGHPESIGFYPTALIADDHVITYIAGTPVVTAPYLGDRPAFDGSDYIVNISSINRDIRLMQQRRRLYRAYQQVGYPAPNVPIIALSGKAEANVTINRSFQRSFDHDLTLGSSEIDLAAALNDDVEAFIGIASDQLALANGTRVSNSVFNLNLGFVNIGNLDKSPVYFTAGQLFAPFGRYSSSMISAPLTMTLARTKTQPFILGYKSQTDNGPYAALYGFSPETQGGSSTVSGFNAGYIFNWHNASGDLGAGIIGTITDAQGMQKTGSTPLTTFGGFNSATNGSERVKKIPGVNIHGNLSYDSYSLTAEWVGATTAFPVNDLSFNGHGAKPQAAQLEAGITFKAFDKPASIGLGYQWSKETLALNLPEHRLSGVFNISVWKDTVESIEYQHDTDFKAQDFANGAAPAGLKNNNTLGTGRRSDSVVAQVGVYF